MGFLNPPSTVVHELFWGPRCHTSGQIIATSHNLTPNGGLVREMGPLYFRET